MTRDYNPADWELGKLQTGLNLLDFRRKYTLVNDGTEEGERYADALQHTIDFIEYHIDAGDVKSPLQTYLTEK